MVRSADGVAPLPKGEACKRCKARKTRCSGDRPACQACLRSARFKHVPLSEVTCIYGDAENETDPRELGGVSNKAPRLSFDDRTSSTSSFGSTSSGRSSFSQASSSTTIFSASPGGYETDATSPPHSQSSLSYSSLSLPLPMYPPIPLAPPPHHHRPPPQPAPPVSYASDPTVGTLATTMSHNLDFGLGAYQQQPQSLAARRRGIPLAIPLPQPPPFDSGFVPASAPPTLGHFLTSQEAFDRSNDQHQQHQYQYQQPPPPLHVDPPPLPLPPKRSPFPSYESGAVDDWSLPTPVYSSGGTGTSPWRGYEGLPTPLREFADFGGSHSLDSGPHQPQPQPQHQGYAERPLATGLSPWPRYQLASGESWAGGGAGM